jgi:hypothetical protein
MIKDLKELKSLLMLCRKQGVKEITYGDCHVKFGELPDDHAVSEIDATQVTELSDEQLMYYSVEGVTP